jgi:hypothetical protein
VSEKPSRFAINDNDIDISQNFSMVKGKASDLNYSVLGHSQFLEIKEDNIHMKQAPIKPQAFDSGEPKDSLDRVLSMEYVPTRQDIPSHKTPKYQPDLVEMVKNIFGSETQSNTRPDKYGFSSGLFEPSPLSLTRNKNLFDFSSKNVNFRQDSAKIKQKWSRETPKIRRRFGNQIDCSDVLQNIRQRELYRKPLQVFRLN